MDRRSWPLRRSNEQVAAGAPMDKGRSKLAIAPELSELSSAATVEETEQTTTAKEDRTQQHQANKVQTLRFMCETADLGQDMTRTIAKAFKTLGEEHVIGHGYLLLDVESLPTVDWADLSRDATTPPKDKIVGFHMLRVPKVLRIRSVPRTLCTPRQPRAGLSGHNRPPSFRRLGVLRQHSARLPPMYRLAIS
jgi:hypothetical protein